MKKALLAMMVLGFGLSAMASARLVTTEEKIVNVACFSLQGQSSEIRDLCTQLIIERKAQQAIKAAKVEAQQMEKALAPIYKAELAKDESVIAYGGLNSLTVQCNPALEDGTYCRVSAEAGNDGGKLYITIDVKTNKLANGQIERTRLAQEVLNID